MDVATMTMSKEEARSKLNAYRNKVAKVTNTAHRAEYEQIAAGLKQLERGRRLLDMATVFLDCPHDHKGRPLPAIARADKSQVCVEPLINGRRGWDNRGNGVRFTSMPLPRRGPTSSNTVLDYTLSEERQLHTGFALVPMVPIERRPSRFDASAHHILWEVEEWSDRRLGAKPDIDPYLLRHIGGTLFAVIAEWDLTDLERAVMSSRATL